MIKRILDNEFLKNNIIFFIGTLTFSFTNYLYYPIISRLLTVSAFGETQSLITLYMQLGVVFTAFGYLVINIKNNHIIEEEKRIILAELERIALFISVVISAILIFASPLIANSLHYSNPLLIGILAPLIIVTVPYTFRLYYVQSQKKMAQVSIANLVYSIGKLLFAIVLILFGTATLGAISGYIISLGLAWLLLFLNTKKEVPYSLPSIPLVLKGNKYKKDRKIISKQLSLSCFIITMLFAITFLYTADILVIRRYFSAEIAGYYSGVSTISRIIYFLTASVVGVLLASVSVKSKEAENRNLLIRSTFIIALLGISALFCFFLAPKLIINILLGSKYLIQANLLFPIGIVMLISSFVNLLFTYQLALRKYSAIIPMLVSLLVFLLLTTLNHGSLLSIVANLAIANIIALVGGIIEISWSKK